MEVEEVEEEEEDYFWGMMMDCNKADYYGVREILYVTTILVV